MNEREALKSLSGKLSEREKRMTKWITEIQKEIASCEHERHLIYNILNRDKFKDMED